ncbi:ThuA domain-containing protein [Roseibacillus ishigakijimensis]|uniref:ThuA domain-containing protein n=1 Tax=Roseibacillus ishigakijimensis TaxID=454146 RepID=A0A934RJT7_9BACT|nr:ThuA domain-containing protein [Roseibacillus ishigakijimensis]MBK1832739.1 ThuA domain-containing protein [Roseibacillus ishigakijimensis]
MKKILFTSLILCPLLAGANPKDPETTAPWGEKFAAESAESTLQVLLVGSGSSHDFPRDFLSTDRETLLASGDLEVVSTPNMEEAVALLPQAEVLVFSGNHGDYGKKEFQEALHAHADAGKGLVFLHAATWSHPWEGYNDRFIAGRTPSHGNGLFAVTVTDTDHAVTKEVPEEFQIEDENYRFELADEERVHVCCENAADQTEGPIPSVWVVKDPKTRIVCITLGHDDKAHKNEAYQKLLINAVQWVAEQ